VTRRWARQWRYLVISCAVAAVAVVAMIVISQRKAPAPATNFFPITYSDSLVSVNDRCMVRHGKLNPDVHPVYVNGMPMGFC
jgi:anti-sigma-K factor RskA